MTEKILFSGPRLAASCYNCNKKQESLDERLKRCSRCLQATYCSTQCQKKHWKLHKPQCVNVTKAPSISVTRVVKEKGLIIYLLPGGKPDPIAPFPERGMPDTRRRVPQMAYKANTCWYYTFNYLRDRYGKHPSSQKLPGREFEKLASTRRKEVSAHEDSLVGITDQLNQPAYKRILSSIVKKTVDMNPAIPILREALGSTGGQYELEKFDATIDLFKKQIKYHNLYDFLLYLKLDKRKEINEVFLKKIGESPSKIFEKLSHKDLFLKQKLGCSTYESIEPRFQRVVLDYFILNTCAQGYGLRECNWQPTDSIDSLISTLDKDGPFSISGEFGKPHYEGSPLKSQSQVEGRDIFFWRSGSFIKSIVIAHSILIIGARKLSDKEYVYYIDSADLSDPKNSQPIYMMSYKRMKQSACDLLGFQVGGDRSVHGFGYHRSSEKKEESKKT